MSRIVKLWVNYFVIWIPERSKIDYTVDRVFMHMNSYKYCGLFLADKVLNENDSSHLPTSLPKSSQYRIILCTSYYILSIFIIHDSTL